MTHTRWTVATWICVAVWLGGASYSARGDELARPEIDEAAIEAHLEKIRSEGREELRLKQQYIQDVAYQLVRFGATICDEAVAPILGASLARRNDFIPGHKKKEVEAAFDVSDDVKVFAVAKGSPAERADLLVGDEILEVNGRRIKKTKHVFEELRNSESGDPALRVRRNGTELDLTLPREMGCDSGVRVNVSPQTETGWYPNRRDVAVPTGLVDFVEDDDELAIAIAHQIAHRLIESFREVDEEPKADRVGLFLAARAGFDVSKAPGFWDRVAAQEPWKIPIKTGSWYKMEHGALALRAPMIRETVADIQDLVATEQPIEP